jgi:hypothetical protein
MRIIKCEIQSEACSTRVHAETRHWFQWNIFSSYEWNNIPISYISGRTKLSIYVVDGHSDCISLWVTWFGYIYIPNQNASHNMYCVKLQKSQQNSYDCSVSRNENWPI